MFSNTLLQLLFISPPHHEHAVRPPVGAVRVAPPVHHLRSHVLHRAAEGVGFVLVVYRLLTEAEVCRRAQVSVCCCSRETQQELMLRTGQLDVSVLIQQDAETTETLLIVTGKRY